MTAREQARARLTGALLGLTTPFTAAGAFDEDAFRKSVEDAIARGFGAFVVGGTYGEVTSLTREERQDVIRAAVEQSAGRAAILADTHHVGSLDEVLRLTRHAEAVGADIAYILTPYYFRPSEAALVEFYHRIAESVRIGIMIYTNPWRTHVRLGASAVQDLVRRHDNVVAIKAADLDPADVSDLAALVGEDIVVSCGWEVHAIHGAMLGAPCYFGIAGNFAPDLEHRYARAIAALDRAEIRRLHFAQGPLRRFFGAVDAPVVLKAAQEMMGLIGGPVRLPLWPMTAEQRRELARILDGLGLERVAD